MCYYNEELQSVIAGDTLFCESVGRTDFPTGNGAVLMNSTFIVSLLLYPVSSSNVKVTRLPLFSFSSTEYPTDWEERISLQETGRC